MNEAKLNEALYEKYIRPTRRKRKKCVGVEIEMPIVNQVHDAVDFELIHAMTNEFVREFNFSQLYRDDKGEIYSAASSETGDGLSYDCSYNTLEFSFGPVEDINVLHRRFIKYVGWIQAFLTSQSHMLTGMGINPNYALNRKEPVPTGRYRMLFHHLSSYHRYGDSIPFHSHPDFGMYSCASQVQLDVEEEMLTEVLHTFSRLEPLKAVLFSNSIWNESHDILCVRDSLWKRSLHGINPHNVNMYHTELNSPAEVLEYIKSMSMFCVERDDKYLNFSPVSLRKYFDGRSVIGEYFDGEVYRSFEFQPELEDLAWLRSYKFVDVTYRGTVEFRSMCCQPFCDAMAPAAFHAGLMEVLPELTALLDEDHVIYHHGYTASELRELFIGRTIPNFVEPDALSNLLLSVIDLARKGLELRGFNEETYLEPLCQRARMLQNPASVMANGLDSGTPIDTFIRDYAKLQ